MAFASHTNDRRPNGEPLLLGNFIECDFENLFEYSEAANSPFEGFDQQIYVGNNGETRFAKILKTVAYIVIDEGDDGAAITEKWQIRRNRAYNLEGLK